MTEQYKILLLGDGNVGKTSWLNNFKVDKSNDFACISIKMTDGVKDLDINIDVHEGNIYDNSENTCKIIKDFYKSVDFAIIFYDTTNRASFTNLYSLIQPFKSNHPNTPYIIVGNKADIKGRVINDDNIKQFRQNLELNENQTMEISAYIGYQCDKPLLTALRILKNNENLNFKESLYKSR